MPELRLQLQRQPLSRREQASRPTETAPPSPLFARKHAHGTPNRTNGLRRRNSLAWSGQSPFREATAGNLATRSRHGLEDSRKPCSLQGRQHRPTGHHPLVPGTKSAVPLRYQGTALRRVQPVPNRTTA